MRTDVVDLSRPEPLAKVLAQHRQGHLAEARQQQRLGVVKGLIERGN